MRLTNYLFSRLFASGVLILLITMSWLMSSNHRYQSQEVGRAADTVSRLLEIQSVGPLQGIGLEPRFPDWYPVTQVKLPRGACVKLLNEQGAVRHSTCRGRGQTAPEAPAWFAWLYQRVFSVAEVARRELQARQQTYSIEIIPNADTEIAAVWSRLTLALNLSILVTMILGATAAWLIHRALKPMASIVDSLQRIGQGEFETRSGMFKFRELNQIATTCNQLANELGEKDRQRDALIKRLQTAQEDERRSIALELHDEFGQYLTAINANAAALQSADGLATVKADATRIQNNVEHLMGLVQALLSRLRPHPMASNSLLEIVRNLIAEITQSQTNTLAISLKVSGPIDECPNKIATAGYRIVQEALTNILKHSNANKALIDLSIDDNMFKLSVSDNGNPVNSTQIVPGFGVSGMHERATALGGQLKLIDNEDLGITVEATFPIQQAERS